MARELKEKFARARISILLWDRIRLEKKVTARYVKLVK